MKALSVRQPWASLIAAGVKTIEVRSWSTKHRGPLLICAGKRPHESLPVGVALCVVDVIDCRPFVHGVDDAAAKCEGDTGDFAWVLGSVTLIDSFPVSGKLSLFDVPFKLERPDRAGAVVSPLVAERLTFSATDA
jgi:hypothetical protein